MSPVHRRYLREFIPAMAGYIGLILGSVYWLKLGHPSGYWRPLIALLPVLPIVLVMRAMVRVIRDSDELERRIELEAVAISAMMVGMVFFSGGLLASADVISLTGESVAIWVLPALCGTYGLAKCWAIRRYR
jgi:hypothetical protein